MSRKKTLSPLPEPSCSNIAGRYSRHFVRVVGILATEGCFHLGAVYTGLQNEWWVKLIELGGGLLAGGGFLFTQGPEVVADCFEAWHRARRRILGAKKTSEELEGSPLKGLDSGSSPQSPVRRR